MTSGLQYMPKPKTKPKDSMCIIFPSRATISVAFCCHVVLPYCPIHCLLRCVLWVNKVMMMIHHHNMSYKVYEENKKY